jgi:hypothetical protein
VRTLHLYLDEIDDWRIPNSNRSIVGPPKIGIRRAERTAPLASLSALSSLDQIFALSLRRPVGCLDQRRAEPCGLAPLDGLEFVSMANTASIVKRTLQ